MRGFRYTAQPGDVAYSIPGDGVWGAVFSRGADPGGARCPVRVVLRAGRVFPLYPASAYGILNTVFATEEPMTAGTGLSERAFCDFVGLAFRNATGDSRPPPTSLARGAEVWRWPRVS